MTCVMIFVTTTVGKTNFVWAANASPSPDFVDPVKQPTPPTQDQIARQKTVDIAPEPPAPPEAALKIGYFHKERQALSAVIYGAFDSKETDSLKTRASLLYLFPDANLQEWEAGADLLSDGSGSLSIALRWIFSRTRFRPYTKAGVAVRIDPGDEFRTFLKFENYQARGDAGFELLLGRPISLRCEVELTASGRSVEALAGAGLAWAW